MEIRFEEIERSVFFGDGYIQVCISSEDFFFTTLRTIKTQKKFDEFEMIDIAQSLLEDEGFNENEVSNFEIIRI